MCPRRGKALDSASLLSCLLCPPLSGQPVPTVMPAGFPLSCPPVPPLSFPPVSLITNVGDKVSGNPGSCSSVPSSGGPAWGKAVDSRLKTSGMTGRNRVAPQGLRQAPVTCRRTLTLRFVFCRSTFHCHVPTTPHPGPLPQGEREKSKGRRRLPHAGNEPSGRVLRGQHWAAPRARGE